MSATSAIARRRKVIAAVVAAIAAATTDVAYIAVIIEQNATGPNPGVVPFLVVYIAAIAAAALLSAVLITRGRSATAEVVLISAAAGSGALGFLGIFSIGLGLLITAGLLLLAVFGFEPHARRLQQQEGGPIAPGNQRRCNQRLCVSTRRGKNAPYAQLAQEVERFWDEMNEPRLGYCSDP